MSIEHEEVDCPTGLLWVIGKDNKITKLIGPETKKSLYEAALRVNKEPIERTMVMVKYEERKDLWHKILGNFSTIFWRSQSKSKRGYRMTPYEFVKILHVEISYWPSPAGNPENRIGLISGVQRHHYSMFLAA